MKARFAIAAAAAVAALVLASVAAPRAQAMAMYNDSTYYEGGTSVDFVCGFLCGWFGKTMPYREQISYPGKGGSFQLEQDGCTTSSGHPNIESHGYAELSGADLNSDSDGIEWSMWGNGGSPVSGSPFSVVCFPTQRPLATTSRAAASWLKRVFRAWDTNRDGILSLGELGAGSFRTFRQLDLNHDGMIDARDVRRDLARQRPAVRRRASRTALPFDLSGNGRVRPREYWFYVRHEFVRPIGGGRVGSLSLAQVKAYYAMPG